MDAEHYTYVKEVIDDKKVLMNSINTFLKHCNGTITKDIYDSKEEEKNKKIKEIISNLKNKEKNKKNGNNDSSSETSKTKEISKNENGKNLIEKK